MASLPNVNNAGAMPVIQLDSINAVLIDMSKMLSDKLGDLGKMIKMDSARDKKEQSLTAAAEARQKALDAENKRESMFSKKSSLGKGASTVGSALGKSVTGGGMLQALLGGAILAAIFAPEKLKSVLKAIGKGVESLLDNKWLMKNVDEFIKGLNLTNLFSFLFLGIRGGLVVSAFKFAGEQLADLLGFKEGDDTGEATLGEEIKGYVRKAIIGAASGLGIFAFLFPGVFFRGMLGVAKGASNLIASRWAGGMGKTQAGAIGTAAAAQKATFLGKIKNSLFGTVTGVSSGIVGKLDSAGNMQHDKGSTSTGFMSAADQKTLQDEQKKFKKGILGKVGKGGLIGMVALAMAAVTTVLLVNAGDGEDGASTKIKEGLDEMKGAATKMFGTMSTWMVTGAMLGSFFPVIGTAIGAGIGAMIGAAVGFFNLSEEDKKKFASGIVKIWDGLIEKFTNVIADMLDFLLPSFMIPDWVKKAKSTEQEKLASTTAKVAKSNEKVATRVAEAKLKSGDEITDEQKAKMAAITADTPSDVEKQLNKIVPGLTSESRNKLGSTIAQRNRDVETQREAKANIGAEERGLSGEIDTLQGNVDMMKAKDAAVRARIIADTGVTDPALIEKMMVGHKDKNEAEIKKSEKRIAALKNTQQQVIAKEDSSGGIRSGNIAIGKDVKNTALMEFLSSSREAQLIAMQVMGESVKAADSGRMYSDSGGMGGGQAGGSSTTTQNVSTTTTNYQSGIPMSEQYRMRTTVGRLVAGGRVGGM
jgi:hypothetical protein